MSMDRRFGARLPSVCWHLIASLLAPRDLAKFAMCSRYTHDDIVWNVHTWSLATNESPYRILIWPNVFCVRTQHLKTLLGAKADVHARWPDGSDRTVLHYTRSCDAISLLLDAKADINAIDAEGVTPLLRELFECNNRGVPDTPRDQLEGDISEAAQLLIARGADLHITDHFGYSPGRLLGIAPADVENA
jgi:hypothetical protein